ncbi:hypothetical protein D3C84_1181090 [compost metagenome]
MKNIVEAVVVRLVTVICQSIADEDAVKALNDVAGFWRAAFDKVHRKFSRELLVFGILLVEKRGVFKIPHRPPAGNFFQIGVSDVF